MFEGVVLGIDPGIGVAGLAVVAAGRGRLRLDWSRTVRTPSDMPEPDRLRLIYEAVEGAISEHRPVAVAVERVMWGRNTTSALSVARATGVVMLSATLAGVLVEEYAPLEVKMAVTGVGNASKEQVRTSLTQVHRLGEIPKQPDAADAVAVALCHCFQSHMRAVARQAGVR